MQLSAEYLKNLTEIIPGNIIIYTFDEGLKLVCHSAMLGDLLGFKTNELKFIEQQTENDLIVQFDHKLVLEKASACVLDNKPVEFICRMIHKTEEYIWVRISVKLLGEYNGKPALLAVVFDYSSDMYAKKELLEMSDRAICLVDKNTKKIIYANQSFATTFSVPIDECMGHIDAENIELLRSYLVGEETLIDNEKVNLHKRHEESRNRYFMVLSRLVKFGEMFAIAFYLDDITEMEIVTKRLSMQNRQIQKMQAEAIQAYRRQLDTVMRLNPDAVSTFQINITQNICKNGSCKYDNLLKLQDKGTLDGYFEDAGEFIPAKEYADFRKVFNRDYLLQEFAAGRTTVIGECYYLLADGYERMLRTIVSMIQNPVSRDIEGIMYTVDVTDKYISRKIKEQLLNRRYEGIFMIDVQKKEISVVSTMMSSIDDFINKDSNYERLVDYFANNYIAAEERFRYIRNSSLSGLREELANHNYYSFTISIMSVDGNNQLMRFSFSYLDESKNHILSILEDVTYDLSRDVLTGAYSRQGFINYAEKFLWDSSQESKYAILFFNIRGFKAINELFGISGGDRVLAQSVELLRQSELQPIAVGRLEADHFVCLINQNRLDYQVLVNLCQRMYVQDSRQFRFYAHCGVYLIKNKQKSVGVMCDYAKMAKEFTVDNFAKPYAVFDNTMRDRFVEKKELTSEFKGALENDEFVVFYQPVFSAKTGEIVSAEALVRWQHGKRGMISPGKFIPIFEENGFISELDFFVENSVIKFLQNRLLQDLLVVPIAINLSRMDFMSGERRRETIRSVKSAGVPLDLMRIEITESAYASMAESSTGLLDMMRDLGIKILIDDFGSGYSSFSTLKDFKFDILKLDMGFVQQIGISKETELIIQSLIEMAHKLGVEVIAEGVETKEQADFLAVAECDYIQGYYYSRPLPQANFEEILNKS